MRVFDSSVLLLALDPDVKVSSDPATNKPVEFATERVENLIRMCKNRNERIIIPTPVLSEVLVNAKGASDKYLGVLEKRPFSIAPFDKKAAIEAAILIEAALRRSGQQNRTETKTKIKFDRQIVAIAKSQGADTIYSDDKLFIKYARHAGIAAIHTSDLPLPSAGIQMDLFG